jgi:hypothetical protein
MKKWIFRLLLDFRINETQLNIPIWIIYVCLAIFTFGTVIGNVLIVIAVPGIARLLYTMVYSVVQMVIYLIPGKKTWELITSPFNIRLHRIYEWMHTEPK